MQIRDILYPLVPIFVLFLVINNLPGTPTSKYRAAIEECERTLPRNQKCKIIAIPVVEPSPQNTK